MQNMYQQEPGITASDMMVKEDNSDIKEFYRDSCVFITGATGFLGKLAMEKLLRTCTDIQKIYIMIRPKKGKDAKARFDDIFNEPTFDYLKLHQPTFKDKIHAVIGDVGLPDLGLSEIHRHQLIQDVNCVMHYAATVRFDEKLRLATYINVRGVRDLLRLANEMKKLKVFLHVSTAFSNCTRKEIDETFYEPPITGEKLLNLVECLDDDQLDAMTKWILKGFPNTYAFTKCVAEDILRKEGKNLPVALYRPSIVTATVREPMPGWIDNVYGPTGIFLGVSVGLLRSLYAHKRKKAEMVPADYVINSCLAAMWDVATTKTLGHNKQTQVGETREEKFSEDIPVYNFVSTPQNPLTWEQFHQLSHKHARPIPSAKVVWYCVFKLRSNYYEHLLAVFFLHTVPAYIVDFVMLCLGKKPRLVRGYKKIHKLSDVLAHFTTHEWKFKNDNIQSLWKRMKNHDQELFGFDVEKLNWDLYFYSYVRGARVYLLKDPLDTATKGAEKYCKLMVLHYILLATVWFLIIRLAMVMLSYLFGL